MYQFAKLSQVALVIAVTTGCSNETIVETKPSQPVSVITISDSHTQHDLRFSGVLEAQEKARLAFRVAGTLKEIHVAQGEYVEKGQVIASLDPHDYQVRVAELEGRLNEANASYLLAKNEFERTQIASDGNAMSDISLDRTKTGVTRAKSAVTVVEQNLQQAKDALAYTQLIAPFSGVVGQRSFDNFEQVSPGISFVTLHQPKQLQAIIDIPESMLPAFSKGQIAQVSSHDHGQAVSGIVTEIASIPDSIKRTFSATVALNGSHNSLYPGKVINVRIADQTLDNSSVCLPASALVSHLNAPQVTKLVGNTASRINVDVIKQGRNDICVKGDIAQNDIIVVAGSAFIADGSIVDQIIPVGGE